MVISFFNFLLCAICKIVCIKSIRLGMRIKMIGMCRFLSPPLLITLIIIMWGGNVSFSWDFGSMGVVACLMVNNDPCVRTIFIDHGAIMRAIRFKHMNFFKDKIPLFHRMLLQNVVFELCIYMLLFALLIY